MPEIKNHFASHKQPSKRVPAKPAARASRSLKTKHAKSGSKLSLKAWARAQKDDVTVIQVQDWFHNKRANFSSNEKCIGRTRTRVKKGGGGKPEGKAKNLSGR